MVWCQFYFTGCYYAIVFHNLSTQYDASDGTDDAPSWWMNSDYYTQIVEAANSIPETWLQHSWFSWINFANESIP